MPWNHGPCAHVNPAGIGDKEPAYHNTTGTDLTDYPEVFPNYQVEVAPPLRPMLRDLCHPKGTQGHQSLIIRTIRKPFRLLITQRYADSRRLFLTFLRHFGGSSTIIDETAKVEAAVSVCELWSAD